MLRRCVGQNALRRLARNLSSITAASGESHGGCRSPRGFSPFRATLDPPFRPPGRLIPCRSLYAQAVRDVELDRQFVEHDMKEPLMPLIPVPPESGRLQSHLDNIWNKFGEEEFRNIVGAVEAWTGEDNLLTRDVYYKLLIRIYSQMHHYQGFKFMNWLIKAKPFELTDFDSLIRLDLASRELKALRAASCFKKVKHKNETAYTLLLHAFAAGHRDVQAEEVIKEMKEKTLITNCYSYTLIIGMYVRMGRFDLARKWFTELETKSNVRPDAFTYWTMVRAIEKLGIPDLELKIQEYLGNIDGMPTGLEWKMAMRLYGSLGRKKDVERMWIEQMRQLSVLPESYYIAAIEAFGMIGEVKRAEELATQLENQKGKASDRLCFMLVKVFCMNGMMVEAEKLVLKMEQKGFKLGFRVYHFLVAGYVKRGQYESAISKFKDAEENGIDGGYKHPMYATVLEVLEAYAYKHDVERAEELVRKMINIKYYPFDIRIFNALLKVYLKSKKPAWGFEKRIEDAKLEPDENTRVLLRRLQKFN